MRFTKIVCTLGPSSRTKEQILALAHAGMNIARINLSHGTLAEHLAVIALIKEINEDLRMESGPQTCVGILLDTKGAEIRTGDVAEKVNVAKGEEILFSPRPLPAGMNKVIVVDHEYFAQDAREAECILIDNGILRFDLVSVEDDGTVVARAQEEGTIGSRRHVNLPGVNLSMPSLTPNDWRDIAFAAKEGVDFLALSFVREAKEIDEVRAFLEKQGANISLIAKIETRQAVQHLHDILIASDALMVARGDLGVEVPFEMVPVIQDDIVRLARNAGKPVIVATHMLESMIDAPMPTRAEATDIAHAAMTRTDATMLSGETASGSFPVESVKAMVQVLCATEEHLLDQKISDTSLSQDARSARTLAAVTLADATRADALIVMTRTGKTALEVSRFRPQVPILAFTPSPDVQRMLQLSYGVLPICIPFDDSNPETTVKSAMNEGIRLKLLKPKQHVVLVSDTKADEENISAIQMRNVL